MVDRCRGVEVAHEDHEGAAGAHALVVQLSYAVGGDGGQGLLIGEEGRDVGAVAVAAQRVLGQDPRLRAQRA
ncbi:hypothetical protein, partial [Streptomyces sp. T21Q-yed]|uniref:hypothetical protein n=1 Tax=Streptomyces sp. T21Q-yed TaxID=3018441 RepID=UPI0023DFF68B